MAIRTTCDGCFMDYNVPDDRAGKVFKCKECGTVVRVPKPGQQPAAPPRQAASAAPHRPSASSRRSKSKSSGSNAGLIGGIIGGVALLLVAAGVGYMLMGGDDDAAPANPNAADVSQNDEAEAQNAEPLRNDESPAPVEADEATIVAEFQQAMKDLVGASAEERRERLDRLAAKHGLKGGEAVAMMKLATDARVKEMAAESVERTNMPTLTDAQTRQVVADTEAAMRELGIAATSPQRTEAIQKVADKHGITFQQLIAVVQQYQQQERDERKRRMGDQAKPEKVPFWVPLEIGEVTPPEWPMSLSSDVVLAGDANSFRIPSVPAPYMLTGVSGFNSGQAAVVDLNTGKVAGKLNEEIKPGKRVLSIDGKYLGVESPDQKLGKPWLVYSFESGGQVHEFKDPEMSAHQHFSFIDEKRLLIVYYIKNAQGLQTRARIYDVASGELIASQDGRLPQLYHMAISPDGRYLIAGDSTRELVTVDLSTCEVISKLKLDTVMGNRGSFAGLQFTPDGSQIGILYNRGFDSIHVVSLDSKTNAVIDEFEMTGYLSNLVQDSASYNGPDLMWFPDQQHVLIHGAVIVNLPAGRRVWQFDVGSITQQNSGLSFPPRMAADGCLIVCKGDRDRVSLTSVPIEFDKINQALAESKADVAPAAEPAKLTVNMPVSINIDVSELQGGDKEVITTELTDSFTNVLEGMGFEVVDEAEVVFRLSYREAKGQELQEIERQQGQIRGGTPTGKTVQATKSIATLEWTDATGKKTLWKNEQVNDPTFLVGLKESTAAEAQSSSFKQALQKLTTVPIPYYISVDGKWVLPMSAGVEPEKKSRRPR